ncbi:MAG TPA: exodeoxyribonuclease VII small subunit [Syntrophomonadaceae bacterium]|nr:exodeoxyribonuclease VII small subunit [Syntrophomonadaceae bacterium]HNX28310.1 exodeoxyribonuclease VII small subunit [Syntrophomonadaceae bacterium]HPR92517.1 exodeoxyribonuclease VII small subunit [Syntrophomonadaceae bacterium]
MEIKFETALLKLEKIVQSLENEELELEESIKLFEEGIKLSLYCQQELERADGRIQQLLENMQGELELAEVEINE